MRYLHVDKQSTGFIIDLFRLLNKYGLEQTLRSYIDIHFYRFKDKQVKNAIYDTRLRIDQLKLKF